MVVAIDVRGCAVRLREDERDGKRENSPSATGSTSRFEEGTREPARVDDVGEERIAESAKPEEAIEDIGILTSVGALHQIHFPHGILCLPGIHRAVDSHFRLTSRQTAERGPVALIDQVGDVVAKRFTPCVVRHPAKRLLVDSNRGAPGPRT